MEIRRLEEQGMTRNVLVQRNTKETKITMSLNLDGTGKASLNTGIGFLIICWMDLPVMDSLIWILPWMAI